jgi:hypothetical protein
MIYKNSYTRQCTWETLTIYTLNALLFSDEANHFKIKCSKIKGKQSNSERKKFEVKFPRNVAECTLHNIRDTRIIKVLYTFNLNSIIRNNWLLCGKNKPVYLNIQWTHGLRPAWHTTNLGYDQNFCFDLQPNLELRPTPAPAWWAYIRYHVQFTASARGVCFVLQERPC